MLRYFRFFFKIPISKNKIVNKLIATKQSDVFKIFIRKEWNLLDKKLLIKLTNSMPRRIGDTIAAQGNKIKG